MMLPRPWFASSLRVLVRESFETIILALLVFMVLHISIQNYKVEGPSMQPTLNQNEYLICQQARLSALRPGPRSSTRSRSSRERQKRTAGTSFTRPCAARSSSSARRETRNAISSSASSAYPATRWRSCRAPST